MSDEHTIRVRKPPRYNMISSDQPPPVWPKPPERVEQAGSLLSPGIVAREMLKLAQREDCAFFAGLEWGKEPPPPTWRDRVRWTWYEARHRLARAWDALCGREWDE